jgi:high-affinity Fe2+/Pb2+ permease
MAESSEPRPERPTKRGGLTKCSASAIGGALLGMIAGAAAGAAIADTTDDSALKAFLIFMGAIVGLVGGGVGAAALTCWPENDSSR